MLTEKDIINFVIFVTFKVLWKQLFEHFKSTMRPLLKFTKQAVPSHPIKYPFQTSAFVIMVLCGFRNKNSWYEQKYLLVGKYKLRDKCHHRNFWVTQRKLKKTSVNPFMFVGTRVRDLPKPRVIFFDNTSFLLTNSGWPRFETCFFGELL